MKIIGLPQIKNILPKIDLMSIIAEAFAAYSDGKTVTPEPGELIFPQYNGDTHIKYGYIRDRDYYVVKVASGFYQNHQHGLANVQGLVLLFSQHTGQPVCLLQDEGYLTSLRTAVASQLAAKYLAPKNISKIGIIGAGTQGKMQAQGLANLYPYIDILVYGKCEPSSLGIRQSTTTNLQQVLDECNLIVTATPSTHPIITKNVLKPGMHIIAIGSDTAEKQELACDVLSSADVIVTDSRQQSMLRGEISHALKSGDCHIGDVIEMGDIIRGRELGRVSDEQIIIADFTGIAPLDMAIAEVVYRNLGAS